MLHLWKDQSLFFSKTFMSKTKSSDRPHYELLYLMANKYSEVEIEPIKAKVATIINDHGGVITYAEDFGKKRLAYQVKGFHYGYYQIVEFDLDGPALSALENKLRLDNEILRHQIIRQVKKSASELAKEKARRNHVSGETTTDETIPPAPTVTAPVPTKEPATEPTPSIQTADKPDLNGNQDSLDNRLDQLLDSDLILK